MRNYVRWFAMTDLTTLCGSDLWLLGISYGDRLTFKDTDAPTTSDPENEVMTE